MDVILLIYLAISVGAFMAMNNRTPNKAQLIAMSFFPGVNVIYGLFGMYQLLSNSDISCTLGLHKGKVIYDSEEEKWKDGRHPMRISVGGYTTYCCQKCGKTWNKTWKAF